MTDVWWASRPHRISLCLKSRWWILCKLSGRPGWEANTAPPRQPMGNMSTVRNQALSRPPRDHCAIGLGVLIAILCSPQRAPAGCTRPPTWGHSRAASSGSGSWTRPGRCLGKGSLQVPGLKGTGQTSQAGLGLRAEHAACMPRACMLACMKWCAEHYLKISHLGTNGRREKLQWVGLPSIVNYWLTNKEIRTLTEIRKRVKQTWTELKAPKYSSMLPNSKDEWVWFCLPIPVLSIIRCSESSRM